MKPARSFFTQRSVHSTHLQAFTLIELALVIMIVGVLVALLTVRSGNFSFWREEGFLRRLSETIVLLHHQAVTDQAFYLLKFDFRKNEYSVNVMRPEEEEASDELLQQASQDAGNLSLELAAFLSPALGKTQTLIPPPSFPSLAEPVPLPPDVSFIDVRTMRGVQDPQQNEDAYILFSPRGFSEFAVIHLRFSQGNPITILINPFTGLTEIYRSYKDFEWTYGRNQKKN